MAKLKDLYKKALVTGGAGFIGSHLVDSLLKEGLSVISIDNYVAGKKENLRNAHTYGDKFVEAECDMYDYDELEKYFSDVDIVFNIAASKMTVCLEDPMKDLHVNAGGALNIMLLSKKYNVKKVVHASTGSVYGTPEFFPTTEKHPLNPKSYYGVSKLAGERYVNAFHELYDINTTILRFYHVFGPRQDASDVGGVASIFCRQILNNEPITIFGDGSQIRSFTYVQDLVDINILVALKDETNGEVYNCASGLQVTVKELAESICNILDRKNHPINYKDWRIGDIKFFDVSNDKIKTLGFEFKHNFLNGLEKTILWSKDYIEGKNA